MRRRVQDIIRISRHWSGETYNVDLLSAMGRGEYMGVGKEFVSAKTALSNIGGKPVKKERRKRPSRQALPMPRMAEEV